ncbi:hypothetical protein [Streptomyces uncialis]|uniref:hypothetical protein n=1 Tax=Streptomyces uncialis TaxID=1048205 RepID=UPI0022564717|nr:hypothetical protein [Streptomyces uncialis]MCX4663358.1 hypothetical protein [Streptomyces uncialis]
MERDDVDHLDRLARRIDSPGPVALVDPLSRNLLSGPQGAGLGATAKWSLSGRDIILYGGDIGAHVPVTVSVENVPATAGADLYWRHPVWPGYPVTTGMELTWWAEGLRHSGAAIAEHRLEWITTTGAVLATDSSPGIWPMASYVPLFAAYVRPGVRFSHIGMWEMGASILAMGDVAAELVSARVPPAGEGTPPYSITRYSHAPSPGNGALRDIALELVEVTR